MNADFSDCVKKVHDTSTPLSYHWRELPSVSFLWQTRVCRDKLVFVATNLCLSRQNIFCREKSLVAPKIFCRDKCQTFCRGKHPFVATTDVFCCDTKMRLVAAPANDILEPRFPSHCHLSRRLTMACFCSVTTCIKLVYSSACSRINCVFGTR